MGTAGKGAQLRLGCCPIRWFCKSPAVEREGLIGAEDQPPAIALRYDGGFFTGQQRRDRHRRL